jgi:hypothetical protein
MHHRTELPFVDEFRCVSLLHLVKNEWHNSVPLWCMSQMGPPSIHYWCADVLRSSIVLPPVGHSSNHEYHCCQLTGQSRGVSNFYHTFFKGFIWLCFVVALKGWNSSDIWEQPHWQLNCCGDKTVAVDMRALQRNSCLYWQLLCLSVQNGLHRDSTCMCSAA